MASRKAKLWLRSIGMGIDKPHTGIELGNFSAGTGHGRYTLPYHVIRFRADTGDSKSTVGWAKTLSDARREKNAIMDGHRDSNNASKFAYYIRDIRNGSIYK